MKNLVVITFMDGEVLQLHPEEVDSVRILEHGVEVFYYARHGSPRACGRKCLYPIHRIKTVEVAEYYE